VIEILSQLKIVSPGRLTTCLIEKVRKQV